MALCGAMLYLRSLHMLREQAQAMEIQVAAGRWPEALEQGLR